MATFTLKNAADTDVVYTVTGADMSSLRAVALAVSTPTASKEITVSQQRSPLGSRGSRRCNVKVADETVISETSPVVIHKQSMSLLITIPPTGSVEAAADEWAALKTFVDAQLSALAAGVVPG